MLNHELPILSPVSMLFQTLLVWVHTRWFSFIFYTTKWRHLNYAWHKWIEAFSAHNRWDREAELNHCQLFVIIGVPSVPVPICILVSHIWYCSYACAIKEVYLLPIMHLYFILNAKSLEALSIGFSLGKVQENTSRLWAHFRATDLAAPMVVTVRSSVEEFQALAMRLAAKVFYSFILPLGNNWKSTEKSHRIYDSKLALTTLSRCKTKLSLLMGFA